ncbi:LPXTG cell wall anchor domain-containing protein [Carnobacterium divergens]|nr:LPXTG cell wall anchor domain-containing protein [Carnobacterium divergens]
MLIKVKMIGFILALLMVFPYSACADSNKSQARIEFTGSYEEPPKPLPIEKEPPKKLPQTGDHMSLNSFLIGMLIINSALIVLLKNKKNKKEIN